MLKKTALILAGGRGERLWPRSRKNLPKQFLSLKENDRTMIQNAVRRLLPLVKVEDIYISTNVDYKSLVREQLPEIPEKNILCEPVARNTAPCIGLAASVMEKRCGECMMMVLPADHLIIGNAKFVETLRAACHCAEDGTLTTIGITPTYPETGFGYIRHETEEFTEKVPAARRVISFVEKPNEEKAQEYVDSGEYLWNSGMFVWKTSAILARIREFLPEMSAGIDRITAVYDTRRQNSVMKREFEKFEPQSIDYGVMEHAKNITVVPGTFSWNDAGSWLFLDAIRKTNKQNNIIDGSIISIDTKNCIVSGNEKLIALVGVEGLIVVDTSDAMLICAKDSTQDIKKVIEKLKGFNRDELL